MTTRILPSSEWSKLHGTEAESIVSALDPAETRVIVVEDAEAIVGAWVLLRFVHAECLWIAPSHRGRGRVLARLLAGMRGMAQAWGVRAVITGSLTPQVDTLILKYGGVELPGRHFSLPVGG